MWRTQDGPLGMKVRTDVAVVYVARGNASVVPTLNAIQQVRAWMRDPGALRFFLLAGERCISELAGLKLATDDVSVVDVTDRTLRQQFQIRSPLAFSWLQRTAALGGKQHTYTVPKLFLHELLPAEVSIAIILDADIVALTDLMQLVDEVEAMAEREPDAALFYAPEQQNLYRWRLRWNSEHLVSQRNGVNGGVGVLLLQRLRRSVQYRTAMQRLLVELDGVLVGGNLERMGSLQLGDQTVLSAMAIVAPGAWSQLMRQLPSCAWNWQTCVHFYRRLDECPLFEGKHNMTALAQIRDTNLNCSHQPQTHDGSCHEPPRLLHFNCPADLKALTSGLDRFKTTFATLVASPAGLDAFRAHRAVQLLDRALKAPEAAAMCLHADRRPIGSWVRGGMASSTFCNASFLLTRLRETAARAPSWASFERWGDMTGAANSSRTDAGMPDDMKYRRGRGRNETPSRSTVHCPRSSLPCTPSGATDIWECDIVGHRGVISWACV
jgi:hypothetical protein